MDGDLSSAARISRGNRDSKANLKKGFWVLDISGTPLRVRKAPRPVQHGGRVAHLVGRASRWPARNGSS
jgi:hypothetical protein